MGTVSIVANNLAGVTDNISKQEEFSATTKVKDTSNDIQSSKEYSSLVQKEAEAKAMQDKIFSKEAQAAQISRQNVAEQVEAIQSQAQAVEERRKELTLRQQMKAEGYTNKQIRMAYDRGGAK